MEGESLKGTEKGVEVDPPPFLPAGWRAFKFQIMTGGSAGSSYHRYFKEKHKHIVTIKRAIELEAQDTGEDCTETLRQYEESRKGKGGVPEEADEGFDPQSSGLSEAAFAALPVDSPPGHAAWNSISLAVDQLGHKRSEFGFRGASGKREHFQVTHKAACGNMYAMFRIARACYVKLVDEGLDKADATKFRNECIAKLKEQCHDGAEKLGKKQKRNVDQQATSSDQKTEEGKHDKKIAGDEINGVRKKRQRKEESDLQKEKKESKEVEFEDIAQQQESGSVINVDQHATSSDLKTEEDKQDKNIIGDESNGVRKKRQRKEESDLKKEKKESKEAEFEDIAQQKESGSVIDSSAKIPKRIPEKPEDLHVHVKVESQKELEIDNIMESMPDAPLGHVAHELSPAWETLDAVKKPIVYFKKPFQLQLGLAKVGGNREAALRIGRACYVLAVAGVSKDEVKKYQKDCVAAFKAAMAGDITHAQAMKKRIQDVNDKQPSADGADEEPKQEPKEKDVKHDMKDDVKQPRQEDVKETQQKDVKEDMKVDVKQPKQENVKKPKQRGVKEDMKDDVKQPKQENVKKPKQRDVKKDMKDDVKQPKQEDVKTPKPRDIKEDVKDDVKQPKQEDDKEPQQTDVKEDMKDDVKESKQENVKEPQQKDVKQDTKGDVKEPKREDVKDVSPIKDEPSSESSESSSDSDESKDGKVSIKRRACAKMLVRCGYRCAWDYQTITELSD